MIEKVYIARHGKSVSKPFQSIVLNRLCRIPTELGYYELVLHDHTICPHLRISLTESVVGRVQLASRGTLHSQPTERYDPMCGSNNRALILKSEIGPG